MRQRRWMGMVAVAIVILLIGGLYVAGRQELQAPSATAGSPVAIDVAANESVESVIADLQHHGLIKSAFFFGWYARIVGLAPKLHQGRFLLNDGMSASYIVSRLEGAPDVDVKRVTFSEGLTVQQMGVLAAKAGLPFTADAYVSEAVAGNFSEPFLSGLPSSSTLEGFLFPDTYNFAVDAKAQTVIAKQLQTFSLKALPQMGSLDPAKLYQTVIIASIIEREAKADVDRPLVASVIANRLAIGMPLQVDATVLYGLGIVGRAPSADELKQDTPYNTYLHVGLPPTPISNPGLSSLLAALHPASTDYLFYVSDNCGHNHYSVTEAQHEAQIAQYVGTPCS